MLKQYFSFHFLTEKFLTSRVDRCIIKSTRSPIITSISTRETEMTISFCITMHEECEILNLFQEKFFSSSQSHEQTHDYLNYIQKGYDAWKNISNKQMDQSHSQVFRQIDCKI